MGSILTDATGLHARDCECAACSLGLRPSELERSAALRAVQRGRAIVADVAARSAPQPVAYRRGVAVAPVRVRPVYTESERRELDELRERFRRGAS
jgi:hypothetical protein